MNNPVAYMQVLINPATPYAAYMRRWTGSTLVQIMAGCLVVIIWTNGGILL